MYMYGFFVERFLLVSITYKYIHKLREVGGRENTRREGGEEKGKRGGNLYPLITSISSARKI
jgi:hypothetical protein